MTATKHTNTPAAAVTSTTSTTPDKLASQIPAVDEDATSLPPNTRSDPYASHPAGSRPNSSKQGIWASCLDWFCSCWRMSGSPSSSSAPPSHQLPPSSQQSPQLRRPSASSTSSSSSRRRRRRRTAMENDQERPRANEEEEDEKRGGHDEEDDEPREKPVDGESGRQKSPQENTVMQERAKGDAVKPNGSMREGQAQDQEDHKLAANPNPHPVCADRNSADVVLSIPPSPDGSTTALAQPPLASPKKKRKQDDEPPPNHHHCNSTAIEPPTPNQKSKSKAKPSPPQLSIRTDGIEKINRAQRQQPPREHGGLAVESGTASGLKYTRDVGEVQADVHEPDRVASPQSPVDVKVQPEYGVAEPSQIKTLVPDSSPVSFPSSEVTAVAPGVDSLITQVQQGQVHSLNHIDISYCAPPAHRAAGSFLLHPRLPADSHKKCLVLDLDETLVHSSFKYMGDADFVIPVEIESQVHNVYVVKRPGVDDFMRRMGEIFEIVVFTASLAKYADPVLDLLDVHGVVRHRLFRESCCNVRGNYVKDLSLLGRDLRHVIIIDNSPASYVFNTGNAIPITSWFSDQADRELLDLVPFLEHLDQSDNVMTYLARAMETFEEDFSVTTPSTATAAATARAVEVAIVQKEEVEEVEIDEKDGSIQRRSMVAMTFTKVEKTTVATEVEVVSDKV